MHKDISYKHSYILIYVLFDKLKLNFYFALKGNGNTDQYEYECY